MRSVLSNDPSAEWAFVLRPSPVQSLWTQK